MIRISRDVASFAIGVGLCAIGLIIGLDTSKMQVAPTYAKVGPQVFPYMISAGLVASGIAVIWSARGKHQLTEELQSETTDWRAVVLICTGLILHLMLLKPLGFVLAAIILFLCVSTAFASRRYLRDAIVAVVIACLTYIGFVYGLGLQLPSGIFAGIS